MGLHVLSTSRRTRTPPELKGDRRDFTKQFRQWLRQRGGNLYKSGKVVFRLEQPRQSHGGAIIRSANRLPGIVAKSKAERVVCDFDDFGFWMLRATAGQDETAAGCRARGGGGFVGRKHGRRLFAVLSTAIARRWNGNATKGDPRGTRAGKNR
jgi:hypothetical protein